MPLKIDLHVHTCYSYDGFTTLREVILYAKRRGLNGVAVTDHNTIEGALKLHRKNKPIIVIPGIEVSTSHGHVLALNVTELIPKGLTVQETIERIHDAGGIAIAAHPFTLGKLGIGWETNSSFDAIEVINSASFPFFFSVFMSKKLANYLKLPQTGGSDAHHPCEIGQAYTEVEAESDVENIIESIRKGRTKPRGKPLSWVMRAKGMFSAKKRL